MRILSNETAMTLPAPVVHRPASTIGATLDVAFCALLAFAGAVLTHTLDGAPRFDIGVVAGSAMLFGWRGYASALTGVAIASILSDPTVTTGAVQVGSAAIVAGVFAAWMRSDRAT